MLIMGQLHNEESQHLQLPRSRSQEQLIIGIWSQIVTN